MGGGGGSAPAAPQQTSSNVYQTNIPDYAQPYVTNMLNATQAQLFNTDSSGNITGFNQYQPYTGMNAQELQNAQQAVAGFSPLQQQAQSSAANLQTPGQYGQAMGVTGQGIMGSYNLANQNAALGQAANPQNFQNQVGGYMNPYIQNALAPALQLANQQYGIAGTQMAGQATGQGAFGGTRSALQQGLNQQNQMLAQNQLIGNAYNQAFGAAQNQYNQDAGYQLQANQAALGAIGQGLSGANQLAGLGGQQLAAQQSILGTQAAQGQLQQQNAQNVINQGIQNYATAQQYPLMELGTMSNMLRGLPMQSATTQQYQAAPSSLAQGVGAAGTAATLSALTKSKEGGLLKSKKMASGGIASYGEGDIVDSTKYDLMDMPTLDLQKELASTDSDTIKNQIKSILAMRAGAPMTAAGGGIIAFADSTPENNQSLVQSDQPTQADSAMVNQAYIEAAQRQAAESGYVPPKPAPAAPPTPIDASNAMGVNTGIPDTGNFGDVKRGISSWWNRNTTGSPEALLADKQITQAQYDQIKARNAQPAATPAAAPAATPAAPTSNQAVTAVPPAATPAVNPPAAAPAVAPGSIKQAAPKQQLSPGEAHSTIEAKAKEATIRNATDPNSTNIFGMKLPDDDYVRSRIKEQQDLLGPNDVQSQVDRQEAIRQREEKAAKTRDNLAYAQLFAKMATTPGSFIVAAMTGVQSAIPALISSADKRNEAMNKIDDAIAAIYKSDRLERAGMVSEAYKLKQDATKNYLEASHYIMDYQAKMAQVNAEYAKAGATKENTNYLAGAKLVENMEAANEKIRNSDEYKKAKQDVKVFAKNTSDFGKNSYEIAQKTLADAEARMKANSERASQVMENVTPAKFKTSSNAAPAAASTPLYASNGKGDRIISNDGGKTWQPVGVK